MLHLNLEPAYNYAYTVSLPSPALDLPHEASAVKSFFLPLLLLSFLPNTTSPWGLATLILPQTTHYPSK